VHAAHDRAAARFWQHAITAINRLNMMLSAGQTVADWRFRLHRSQSTITDRKSTTNQRSKIQPAMLCFG